MARSFTQVLHGVSDPSTEASPLGELIQHFVNQEAEPDYSRLLRNDMNVDLLDPPDSYPFVEYSDFDAEGRAMLLTCRVAWAIDRLPADYLTETPRRLLASDLRSIAVVESEDGWLATALAADALKECIAASEKERITQAHVGPQPARPGHLMAEGNVLARVRGMMKDGSGYQRKVTFNEPVNAYTMLSGDRLAKGGDMLTGCTTTDTEEFTIKSMSGRSETRYTAKAVSI